MATQESITLLHLSDTQFGRNHCFGRRNLPEPDAHFDTLLERLTDDLRVLEDHGVKPQLIVVSGDPSPDTLDGGPYSLLLRLQRPI